MAVKVKPVFKKSRFDKYGVPLNQKELDRLKAKWRANQIDPESVAGTPVPVNYSKDPDDLDAEIDFAFDDMFYQGQDEESKDISVWDGELKAHYVGFNTIERVHKMAVDITARDEKSALQVLRNLYNSCLKADYPNLDFESVTRVRPYNMKTDKGKHPHLVNVHEEMGITWRIPKIRP